MKLSNAERLTITMLAEIMENMGLNQNIDPTLIRKLVQGGDEWAIERIYGGIFSGETPTEGVVKETGDILWMWSIIESSIGTLTGSEAAEAATWYNKEFHGFDGNNDTHYGVAHTMINEIGEFSNFHGRALNSHTQTSLPRYPEMYRKFDQYIKAGQAAPLTIDALRDLFA